MRGSSLFGSCVLSLLAAYGMGCAPQTTTPADLEETGGETGDTGSIVIDTGPKDDALSLTTYNISPINVVVKIDTASGTPIAGKQEFTVIANDGKADLDVSDKTTFTLDDTTLGAFGPGTKGNNLFTSTTSLPPGVFGKSTTVHAVPGNVGAKITVISLRTSGPQRDFFFTVPYKKDPVPPNDILKFGTNIKQVDVAILMDTTASMGGEINNLKDTLSAPTTGIIAKLKAAIPSVGVAIAHDRALADRRQIEAGTDDALGRFRIGGARDAHELGQDVRLRRSVGRRDPIDEHDRLRRGARRVRPVVDDGGGTTHGGEGKHRKKPNAAHRTTSLGCPRGAGKVAAGSQVLLR